MDLTADFKSYQERITSSLVSVTRSASQISSQDLGFHRSSSDKFSQSLDAQSTHLLRLTNKLLKAASKDTPNKPPTLQNRDDIEDDWHRIVDVVDDLLEKADRSLDEFTGVIKRLSPALQDIADSQQKKTKNAQGFDHMANANIPKPQLLFEREVDNYDTAAWKPLLSVKPHANMPLEDSIGSGEGGFKHPYAHEIQHMIYPSSVYQMLSPVPFSPPDESQPVFVDTMEAVEEMLQELKLAKEIAIDLEHNDKNSYIGLVCLMQISTRAKDWIVDTLKPWREKLEVLNEVFANPRIVKVFHGAASDIIWLQRDLGLYIVGLFDTYHASNALLFPQKSLKYLLQRFADFEAQKQYQLADWRIRPLPQELIDYARSDTHFLLYVFDNLRNMLLEASTTHESLIDRVLDASRREALQVYERPVYDSETGLNPGGWMRMLLQRTNSLSNEQFAVFKAVHAWRDRKARELDEGDQNIMPVTWLWTIADTMPTFRGAFHQRGVGRLPRYVAENIPEIIEVVKQGIARGKDGPSAYETIEKYGDRAGPMFGRNKYLRRKVEDPNRGVGATIQLLNQSGERSLAPCVPEATKVVSLSSEEPVVLKSSLSQLWGTLEPSVWVSSPRLEIAAQALNSVLPLHAIVRQSLTLTEVPPSKEQSLPTADSNLVTDGTSLVTDTAEDVFTIKDQSGKRKAGDALTEIEPDLSKSVVDELSAGADIIDLSPQAFDSTTDSKRQAKLARKAEKRAKKQAKAEALVTEQANVVPFDYANAESVLHPKKDPVQTGTKAAKQGKDKPMNPLARLLDTSTGAKRNKMGKEMSGKSHTFKN